MARITALRQNIILTSLYQVVQLASPLITAPYISRVLLPEGVGVFSYTKSVQMYFSLVAVLGTSAYGSREIARERESLTERSQIFWEIEALSALTSCVSLAAWFVYVLAFDSEYRVVLLILTLYIVSSLFDITWFYSGLEQFRLIVGRNVAIQVVSVALQFLLVRSAGDVPVYAAVMAGTSLLGSVTLWVPLARYVRRPYRRLHLGRHFRETLVYFVPSLASSLYTYLDKILLGSLTGQRDQNGFYEQANAVVSVGKALTFSALNQVMGPRLSYLYKERRFDEVRARLRKSVRCILCAGCAVAFGIASVSRTFVPWFFGERFMPSCRLLSTMCPLIVIVGVSNCLGSQYYIPAGLRKKSALFVLSGAALNVIVSALLIPRLYALGAVLGTCTAELTIAILYVAFCDGQVTFRDIASGIWRYAVSGAVMYAVVSLVGMWDASAPLVLSVQVSCGAAVYVLLLLLLRDDFLLQVVRSVHIRRRHV